MTYGVKMAVVLDKQNLVLIVVVFCILLLVKLCLVILSNLQKRWKLLKITEGIENGELKDPHWLYGNLKEIPTKEEDRIDNVIRRSQLCENTRRIWLGPFECIITVLNPEYIRLILANSVDSKRSLLCHGERLMDTKNSFIYGFLKHWLGDGLLISGGEKWKTHRRLLTPAFHFEILRPYVKLFADSANEFLDKLEATNGQSIDVFHYVSLMTLDSLLKCSFSYESHCQSNNDNPYIDSVYAMSEMVRARACFVPYHNDLIYSLSPIGRKFFQHCKNVHQRAEATIRERREELAKLAQTNGEKQEETGRKRRYLDFLDVLLQARDEDGNGMEDIEIREEVDTFMFGGHDTTASGISWCLYNLARHPEFQQKCREEVNQLLEKNNKEELEWDDLNQLPFLTMCIKESLRIHPPVPGIIRTLVKDVTLPNGVILPEGTSVAVSPISTHHHHLYWKDPEVFDPTRFTPENSQNRHSYAFVPFSAGPRNCIGQHFAMNELKVVVAMTIRRFKISPDTEKPPQWCSRLVLRSLNGIHLRFTPLEDH